SVVMEEVGILPGILAACTKPNLTLFFVNLIDAAHDVIAFGYLTVMVCALRIDEKKVPPAVTLRRVDDLVSFLKIVYEPKTQILIVRCPDESLCLFIHEVTARPFGTVDFDDAKPLVAAVYPFIDELAAIAAPVNLRKAEVNTVHGRLDLFMRGHIEDIQF